MKQIMWDIFLKVDNNNDNSNVLTFFFLLITGDRRLSSTKYGWSTSYAKMKLCLCSSVENHLIIKLLHSQVDYRNHYIGITLELPIIQKYMKCDPTTWNGEFYNEEAFSNRLLYQNFNTLFSQRRYTHTQRQRQRQSHSIR